MDVKSFLPPLILEKDREKPWMEWIPGTVLFSDVSGFTPMSEALSVLGAEGGEVLTDVLNRYFAAMIGIVHAHGGQVMKFGGDAILCFFPEAGRRKPEAGERLGTRNSLLETRNLEAESLPRALRAAALMQGEMKRFQNIKTPVKRFALKMKIGVAHGECLLAGVGDPAVRCDYVFAGAPVDATSDAEHHAVAGEIVFAGDQCKLQNANCKIEEVEPGFYRILDAPAEVEIQNSNPETAAPKPETRNSKLETAAQTKAFGYISPPHSPDSDFQLPASVSSYLIREIHAMVAEGFGNQVGALLDIVPVFLRFKGFEYAPERFELARFHAFFTLVMEITHRYCGRLNRISMGDKGSTFFILFGAPNSLEKKEELACQWALDIQQEVGGQFPEAALGVGMNAGRVFAGIVGGSGRSEYTVMGDAVNFAARLMQGAQDGQACLSGMVRGRAGGRYDFTDLGTRRFKGKAEPLAVFALEGRAQGGAVPGPSVPLIGRKAESEQVLGLMDRARNGEPSLCVVEGEPGVGKSCLAAHILEQARRDGWTVAAGKGEITNRSHPYAPWKDLFQGLLFQGKRPDLFLLEAVLQEDQKPLLQWFAEFFGLSIPADVEAPRHDEETKKKLFQHQLSRLLLNACLESRISSLESGAGELETRNPKPESDVSAHLPLCVFLDDLHWFDTLSMELLLALLNHLKDQPVFILGTARPEWEKKDFEYRPAYRFLSLETMEQSDVRGMAEAMLGGRVRDDLAGFIYERSKGNPFFTRQILEYLEAEDLLEKRLGEWTVKREARTGGLPGGEGLVLARLSRLPAQAQAHLKMAACIGPSFDLPILQGAMGSRFRRRAMDELLRSGLLQRHEENSLAFPHALVQETLYAAIPQKVRRQQHRRIGCCFERFFREDLGQYCPNLANHFALAGRREKSIHYAMQAAHRLESDMSYPEAARYWRMALNHIGRRTDQRKWDASIHLGRTLIRTGELAGALALAKRLENHARRQKEDEVALHAIVLQYDAMDRMSDYSYAGKARRIYRRVEGIPISIRARILHQIGVAEYRLSNYAKALEAFQILASLGLGGENEDLISSSVFLSSIAKTRGRFDEALEYLEEGLARAEKGSRPYQRLRLEIEKAVVMMDSGRSKAANSILMEVLPKAEGFGDYYLLAVIMLNLGYVSIQFRDWGNADGYLQEAMKIFSSIGVRNGWAKALMNRGIASFYGGQFMAAYQCYFEATQVLEKTGEMNEACLGYFNLAEVLVEQDRCLEAQQWIDKGLRSFSEKDNPSLHKMFVSLKQTIQCKLNQ